jgi:hypothetical protein
VVSSNEFEPDGRSVEARCLLAFEIAMTLGYDMQVFNVPDIEKARAAALEMLGALAKAIATPAEQAPDTNIVHFQPKTESTNDNETPDHLN